MLTEITIWQRTALWCPQPWTFTTCEVSRESSAHQKEPAARRLQELPASRGGGFCLSSLLSGCFGVTGLGQRLVPAARGVTSSTEAAPDGSRTVSIRQLGETLLELGLQPKGSSIQPDPAGLQRVTCRGRPLKDLTEQGCRRAELARGAAVWSYLGQVRDQSLQ